MSVPPPGESPVNRAIRDALRDGEAAYGGRSIRVRARLEATSTLASHEDALYQAVYTIFRALPSRIAPGSELRVLTRDQAGGDVELAWEALEDAVPAPPEAGDARALLRTGPYGDLLDLAVLALEDYCRARTGYLETEDRNRRVLALIPSLRRAAYPSSA